MYFNHTHSHNTHKPLLLLLLPPNLHFPVSLLSNFLLFSCVYTSYIYMYIYKTYVLYERKCDSLFCRSSLLCLTQSSPILSIFLPMTQLHSLKLSKILLHTHTHTPHFLNPFIYQWTARMIPKLGYSKYLKHHFGQNGIVTLSIIHKPSFQAR